MSHETKFAALLFAAVSVGAAPAAWADSVSPTILLAQSETSTPECDPATQDCPKDAVSEPEAQVETKTEVEIKAEPEATVEAEVKTETEVKSETGEPAEKPADVATEPAPAAEPEATAETETKTETETTVEAEAKTETSEPAEKPAETTTTQEPAPEPAATAETEATAPADKPRKKRKPDPAPTAETVAEPAPQPKAAATAEPEPAREQAAPATNDGQAAPTREERRRRDARGDDRGGAFEFSLPIPGIEGRVIIRQDGNITVQSNDEERFGDERSERRVIELPNGYTRIVVDRPNGTRVVTLRDPDGNIVRRVRHTADGREIVLIDSEEDERRERRTDRKRERELHFAPLQHNIPRDRYIVEGEKARPRDIDEALRAAPVEQVERAYSLQEIRRNERLRSKVRRVDLTVTFEFNSAAIPREQVSRMEAIGNTLRDTLRDNPREIFLIEGHTDAPGSDEYNLRLSDARAESVAIVLSDYFNIPPENLVTQGYGESYLKVPTEGRERRNRRVTIRRITPLLQGSR